MSVESINNNVLNQQSPILKKTQAEAGTVNIFPNEITGISSSFRAISNEAEQNSSAHQESHYFSNELQTIQNQIRFYEKEKLNNDFIVDGLFGAPHEPYNTKKDPSAKIKMQILSDFVKDLSDKVASGQLTEEQAKKLYFSVFPKDENGNIKPITSKDDYNRMIGAIDNKIKEVYAEAHNYEVSSQKKWYNKCNCFITPLDDKTKNRLLEKISEKKLLTKTLKDGTLINAKTMLFAADSFKHFSDEELRNIQLRNLLSLKDAKGKKYKNSEISEFSKLTDEQWQNIQKRNLLSLKNAEGKVFSSYEISEFAKLTDEQWQNVRTRNLLSLKSENDNPLFSYEISKLSKLTDKQWEIVKNRFSLKNSSGKAFLSYEISILARLSDKEWQNIQKRNLLSLKDSSDKAYSIDAIIRLTQLTDEQWQNVKKRNLLLIKGSDGKALSGEYFTLISQLAKISDADWESNSEQKQAIFQEISVFQKNQQDTSSLAYVANFEKWNEMLYGKKLPSVEKMLSEFKEKYPDIELLVNNDVSEEKARKIIKITEEYVENHQKSGLAFAKRIMFINMQGMGGCYGGVLSDANTIHININSISESTLAHENGHYRDKMDLDFNNKKIPDELKPIINKILREYANTNNQELIACLTEAIETPGNDDFNNLTKILHVRQDNDGNYILILPKNCNVSREELEKLGAFLRDIRCPEIIPDYNEAEHGKLSDYNQTLIRPKQTLDTIAKYVVENGQTKDVEKIKRYIQKLFSSKNADGKNLNLADVYTLASLTVEQWNNIEKRDLLSLKDADNKAYISKDIARLSELNDEQWEQALKKDLFSLKGADGKIFSASKICCFAELTDKQWQNVKNRKLLSLKTGDSETLNCYTIKKLAQLNDVQWQNIEKINLFSMKNADNKFFSDWDIEHLASLTVEQWQSVQERGLLLLKNADNKAFSGWCISKLSKLSDEQWKNVQKRGLLSIKNKSGEALSGYEIADLAKLSDKDYEKERIKAKLHK